MGLDCQSLRLLLLAKRAGASLDATLTIGRLDLLLTELDIQREFDAFGVRLEGGKARALANGAGRFCEPVIAALGATVVDSMDASGFEGATVIHDLNRPLCADLEERFSLVLDGGTLEHVFDFPTALRSCMSLPRVGGHLLMTLPANNQMGHGFYQFSPDLFFRVFSEENGYLLHGLFLVPTFTRGPWLRVRDPREVGGRIGLNTTVDELSLFVFAERTARVPLFARPPQQSDYAAEWQGHPDKGSDADRLAFFTTAERGREAGDGRPGHALLRSLIPKPLLELRRTMLAGRHFRQRANPDHFVHFEPSAS